LTLLCDRCGYPLEPGQYIYSKHTGKHYCFPLPECERRLRGELTPEEIVLASKYMIGKLHQL